MKHAKLRQALKSILNERLFDDKASLVSYGYDGSFGQYMPEFVTQPCSTKEVQAIVKLANRYQCPIYPRGAGTNLSGGTLPVQGGIVMDFSQWNDAPVIYPDDLIIKTRPGVKTAEIHAMAEKHQLMYPPDPSSSAVCTIGGNLAENAGGPHGVKYGVTKDYVIGLEVVTAHGDIIKTGGQTIKNVTGYDLTKLLVGAEGTLGIITEATLRLIPKPKATQTAMIVFENLEKAGQSISRILTSGVRPSKMEILDHHAINKVVDYAGLDLPRSAAAILLVEVDGEPEALTQEMATINQALKRIGVTNIKIAQTKDEENALWQVRKAVSPAVVESGYTKISEDATVPLSKIPHMFKKISEIKEKYQLNIVIFGHAGDGNLHPTINANMRDEMAIKNVERAVEEIFDYAIALGGTLSGEHGIGTMKKAFMTRELGEADIAFQKAIKHALDPEHLLNPGKIFPEEGETRLVLQND
ncbi:FAD-linked oxidase C-terminal domain-containing protein [Staphylococcus hyicus]|uniref:FAD-binding oxidoreductase n=1 Tax=Staphylococcus hyicus TaxID=1284 RepID=UPI002739D442|nr:FAD-linked oxidase C-terminal domain-containing protein [Staphylococcus hyicus]MDP4448957.1 FAD-linked oxidase C-terminal domain-containing protein [Staphylococcus hyicus]